MNMNKTKRDEKLCKQGQSWWFQVPRTNESTRQSRPLQNTHLDHEDFCKQVQNQGSKLNKY